MGKVLDYKCPCCDAVLKFNPKGQNWKCDYCRNEYTLDDLKKQEVKLEKNIEVETKNKNLDNYNCPNCGASIIALETTSTATCPYCRNTTILKDKLEGEFNPDYVIPFKHTKEDAILAFKKFHKGKILMPKAFNNPKNINEMTGIYIPFWLYDIDTNGSISATCKRVTTFSDSDYIYTKTDVYKADRQGDVDFKKIPVDGATRFDDSIMNTIEPFNYDEMKDFSYSYLSGFLADKYDIASNDAYTIALNRATKSTEELLKKDIKGYNSVFVDSKNITGDQKNTKYCLLPVWMLNIKYKDKIYPFAMNGQTGKLIGDYPIDKKKAVFLWLGIFIGVFLISFILYKVGVI